MNQYEKMEQILADESVRAQVQTMTNPDDVYELLTEKGLDVPKEAFEEFLDKNRPTGIDRIVPMGKSMDFALIWDGYDLIRQMSRRVTIL